MLILLTCVHVILADSVLFYFNNFYFILFPKSICYYNFRTRRCSLTLWIVPKLSAMRSWPSLAGKCWNPQRREKVVTTHWSRETTIKYVASSSPQRCPPVSASEEKQATRTVRFSRHFYKLDSSGCVCVAAVFKIVRTNRTIYFNASSATAKP